MNVNGAPDQAKRPRNRRSNRHPKSFLQALRINKGLTLQALADQAQCETSQVSYWERGVREPSREKRAAYANALGIPVGELGRHIYEAGMTVHGDA